MIWNKNLKNDNKFFNNLHINGDSS